MKNHLFAAVLLLLLISVATVFTGCEFDEEAHPVSQTAQPDSAEPVSPLPKPNAAQLALDGSEPFSLYELDGTLYLDLRSLAEHWDLRLTEGEDETLSIQWEDGSAQLRGDSRQVELSEGKTTVFSAPVLHGDRSWYLPLAALDELWNRKIIFDAENALYRAFNVEAGPQLCLNGSPSAETLLLDGVPTLEAERLAELLNAELSLSQTSDGTQCLKLVTQAHEFSFRSGALSAELDGEGFPLPVSAWTEGERWYLPLAAAEALNCVLVNEADPAQIGLWTVSEGPALWFDGTGLGSSLRVGEVPCASLSGLAAALDGSLTRTEETLQLDTEDHVLSFRLGAEEAGFDGALLPLPVPVISFGEECFAPVEPLAEALGIPRLEGEALIYSRIAHAETLLFVDGRQTTAWTRGEAQPYLRLNEAFFEEGNEPLIEANTLTFSFLGRSVSLTGGSPEISVNGETQTLSAPVCADGEDWYAPAWKLLPALGLSEWADPELDQIYYTHIVRNDSLSEGHRVPVLMYHAVSDNIWGIPELFISPSTLETQIQALLEGGYTAITFEDLDRIDEIEKPVMLTFDDGYDDNYTELFPLLKQYNIKATVFVIVNDLGKNHKLTRDQVREMSDSGLVSIQSHTMSHGYLDGMSEKQLHREHYDSMLALARITGKQPFVMCYPTGKNAGYTRKITAEYYEYGLCMGGPCWVTGDAPYRIYRYYIPRKTSLDTFLSYLAG